MATRRTKRGDASPGETRALTVVVEEMRGHFRVLGEQIGGVQAEVKTLGGEVKTLRGEVSELRGEVGELRGEVRTLSGDVGLLKIAVLDINRQLKNKVDRDEVEPIVESVLARGAQR